LAQSVLRFSSEFARTAAKLLKIYFGFCTISTTSGLLRTAVGGQTIHSGLYVRVIMLVSAVLVGLLIVRRHSRTDSRTHSEWAEGSS